MGNTTYRDALRKALSDGMTADPDIVLIGEEVGRYGGAYGVTKGPAGQPGGKDPVYVWWTDRRTDDLANPRRHWSFGWRTAQPEP